MRDLEGMDPFLTTLDSHKLLPLERALLSALQSGAFVSNYEHSKYDAEKLGFCEICGCKDDRRHWLQCPRYRPQRADIIGWHPDNVELPDCVVHHLLVPRLQVATQWRHSLCKIQDRSHVFAFPPNSKKVQHLFTDGACSSFHPTIGLASWGVVNATMGDVLALGHLVGCTQTIDRAELTAIIAAVSWTVENDIYIWSDSLSTIQLAEYILHYDHIPTSADNYDLWLQFHDALRLRFGRCTEFRWVPSHVDPDLAADAFEAWIFKWNNVVDHVVTVMNQSRPSDLLQQKDDLERALAWWSERVHQLRQFYFKVAEQQRDGGPPTDRASDPVDEILLIDSDGDEDDPSTTELIADQLPLTWQVLCRQTPGKVPGNFVASVLQWFCDTEQLDSRPIKITEVEVVFLLLEDPDFCFPFQIDGSTDWNLRTINSLFHRPTFVTLLRPVQLALQQIAQLFPEQVQLTPPAPAIQLGLYMSFRSLYACLPRALIMRARERLAIFTSSRQVKRTCDLARPWT